MKVDLASVYVNGYYIPSLVGWTGDDNLQKENQIRAHQRREKKDSAL